VAAAVELAALAALVVDEGLVDVHHRTSRSSKRSA